MKLITKTFLLILLWSMSAWADFDVETLPRELALRTEEFLRADTVTARSALARFSDEELQKINTAFKKSHSKEEQRLFWLSEEFYRRNAERVAAERIRYLYFAVLAALGLITAFSFLTFRQVSRQRRPQPTGMTASPAIPAAPAQPQRRTAKKKAKRG
jgi:hypothetical protein